MSVHTSSQQLTGAVLGNYRLEQLAESHPWGPIFQAIDRAGKRYTVRFIVPDVRRTPDERLVILGRLQQEANRVATLSHPTIVPCLDYGTFQGMLYLVYPSIDYPPLRSHLSPASLPDARAVGYLLEQVAEALEYAHERAVLHCNLSTSTILLTKEKRAVISEFGLLSMRSLCLPDVVEQEQYRYEGSTEACAPEQLLGKSIDIYTDIYSLGAVLYRLLTGHAPFNGQTRDEVLRQHIYAKVPPLAAGRSGSPAELNYVVVKAMEKDPSLRFHRAAELVQAYYKVVMPGYVPGLLSMESHTSNHMAVVGNVPAAPQKAKKRSKEHNPSRRRFVAMAGAGLGAAAVVIAAIEVGPHILGHNGAPTSMHNTTTTNNAVLAKTANVQPNEAVKFPIPGQRNPGLLIHLQDGQFVAFDSTCTHVGCAVDYSPQDQTLVCPCHNAVFDPTKGAAVVSGPAPTPLKAINIKVNPNGTITMA
ncbi:MAG TPA: protein kinase [Ktedonobacteraceae bacterium]